MYDQGFDAVDDRAQQALADFQCAAGNEPFV